MKSTLFASIARDSLLFCFVVALTSCPLFGSEPASDSNRKHGLEIFEKSVRPMLVQHCYECHSQESETVRGGLLLDSRAGSRKGGESGPAVVPGNSEASLLVSALRYDSFEMPPKRRLPEQMVAAVEKWIELGAPDPREGDASLPAKNEINFEEAREYWAFQPLQRQTPPHVEDQDWPINAIDQFVLGRLEENGIAPNNDADRRTWLRRVTFDLTGLPPTPAEIRAFLSDPSSQAAEQVVDRLLASPHFGQHWARHWLDLARYADSNGGDINLTFYNAWRYRDYIVDAFNSDKPFDRFVVEQIAGDLLPFDNDQQRSEQLVASGFLIVGPKMLSERDKEKLYMDVVDEQLDTIGKTFLGLTLGCARCHDHKFDPIPTRDYYAMAGILRSTTTVHGIRMNNVNVSGWIEQPLPVAPEHAKKLAAYNKEIGALNQRLKTVNAKLKKLKSKTIVSADSLPGVVVDDVDAQKIGSWKTSTYIARYVGSSYVHDDKQDKGAKSIRFVPDLPKAGRYEVRISYTGGTGRESNVPITIRHSGGEESLHVNQMKQPALDGLFHSLGQFQFEAGTAGSVTISNEGTSEYVIADAVQFIPVELLDNLRAKEAVAVSSAEADQMTKAVKRLEQQIAKLKKTAPAPAPMAMAAADSEKRGDTPIRIRGEPHNQGPNVPRGFLTVLRQPGESGFSDKQSGRLELAHWIASHENTLTARVIVNRIWHHLFGAGLVRSVDNFGHQGETPSHPELLDYLAGRLVEDGWSLKRTIRLVVLSRTYGLGSDHNDAGMAADPQNRLLWRHNRRRLAAESLRDSILAVSGSLDRTMGGSAVAHLKENPIGGKKDPKVANRRSLYLALIRNELPEMLTVFDLADPDMVVGARAVTTVPSQALLMMNSDFVSNHAAQLAESVLEPSNLTDRQRLNRLFERMLGRPATPGEQTRSLQYIHGFVSDDASAEEQASSERTAWTSFAHAIFASTEFRFVD